MTSFELVHADCMGVMVCIPDNSIDSVVTDPPYELTSIVRRFGKEGAAPAKFGRDGAFQRASGGFMGKTWDSTGIAFRVDFWAEVLRILKPGGHLVAFGGTRTFHRMACAIEDSGFEIRDQMAWIYGSGFPKSHDVSKAIDRAAGAERELVAERVTGWSGTLGGAAAYDGLSTPDVRRVTSPATDAARQWAGWGTALKPSQEPICLARKALDGTVAENVMRWGVGALNIDACRIGTETVGWGGGRGGSDDPTQSGGRNYRMGAGEARPVEGRWPANIMHDGSPEVLAVFPSSDGQRGDLMGQGADRDSPNGIYGDFPCARHFPSRNDSGSAARFFYCPKASKRDREEGCEALPRKSAGVRGNDGKPAYRKDEDYDPGVRANTHPTVKPTELMRYLCRLVTPPGGRVFDPFTGSGSTGKAALLEGFRFLGAEMTAEYIYTDCDRPAATCLDAQVNKG